MHDEIILSIPGMACCSCVSKIENKLKEQDGVEKVEVDFDSKTAKVDAKISAVGLITAIKTAGYEAEQIK